MGKGSKGMADLSGLDSIMTGEAASHASNYQMVAIARIIPDPAQPRRSMDDAALHELANSIKERGVRQPISIRKNPDDPSGYVINYGERRWRASQIAGLSEVPAIIQDDSTASDQLVENIQREDLSALDIARAIVQAISERNIAVNDLARQLGKPKDWVSLYKQLGEADDDIQALYSEGVVTHARALIDLSRARKKRGDAVTAMIEEYRAAGEPVTHRHLKARLDALGSGNDGGTSKEAEVPPTPPQDNAQDDSSPEKNGASVDRSQDNYPPAERSSPAEPATTAAEGGGSTGDDDQRKLGGDSKDTWAADKKPPRDTRRPAGPICVTVEWDEDADTYRGRLVLERQAGDGSVEVESDEGGIVSVPASVLRIVSLT